MKRDFAVLMLFFGISAPAFAAGQSSYVYADWNFYSFSNAPVDGSDAIRIGGGYHFDPYVGLEAGIALIRPFLWRDRPSFGVGDGVKKSLSVSSSQIAVIGSIPVTQRNSMFGKLGWASTTLDFKYSVAGGISSSGSATKSNPLVGFGWQFTPGQNSSLRLQYEYFGKVKLDTNYNNPYSRSSGSFDITVRAVSVGIGYNF
jgi:opacity protein-like surface antigen